MWKPRSSIAIGCASLVAAAIVITVVITAGSGPDEDVPRRLISTQSQTLDVLAGSSSTLIYGRIPRRALDMRPGGAGSFNNEQIVARDVSGHERVIATITQRDYYWSLVGSLLTAARGSGVLGSSVDWWNLSTHQSGHLVLPFSGSFDESTFIYASAAPGGILARNGKGTVELIDLSGRRTVLGRPFPGSGTIAADDHGAVLGGEHGEAAYLSFTKPYRLRPLRSGMTLPLQCEAVNDRYAGCLGGVTQDHVNLTRAALMPLDGGAPTVVATNSFTFPSGAALSSDNLVWIDSAESPRVRIAALSAGDTEPSIRDTPLMQLTSAYNEAIALSADRHTLVRVDSSGATSTLLSAPKASVTYASFAIGNGQVATIDDMDEPAHPDSELSVHAWPLSAAGTIDKSRPPRLVGTGSHQEPVNSSMLAACGRTVVYATSTSGESRMQRATLHVVGPGHTTAIRDALRGGLLQCSGSQVLYCRSSPHSELPRGGERAELHLYDLDTGTDRFIANVADPYSEGGYAAGTIHIAALDTNTVAYLETGGDVAVQDLSSGAKTTVTHLNWRARAQLVSVYLLDNHVLIHRDVSRGGRSHDRAAVYNVNGSHRPLDLPGQLIGVRLVSAGIVTQTESLPEETGSVPTRSFSLRTWDGRVLSILPEGVYLSDPSIRGNTLAWIDENDVLQTRGFTS